MSRMVDIDSIKRKIEHDFDMQDLYLPCHFIDAVDELVDEAVDESVGRTECSFCSANQEWEDIDNGFFMEMRLDQPWHMLHINLGYDTPRENDIEIDMNYCPVCGRKLTEVEHEAD